MRSFLAGLLILLGALLTFPSSLAFWEQRVLMDEERFVRMTQDILGQPAVQDRIAQRIGEEAQRLAAEEGEELDPAAVSDAALQVARELPHSELGETLFRTVHRLMVRILRADVLEYDTLVLETKPLIERVNADLGYQIDVARIEALQGQGLVVVREEEMPNSFKVARRLDAAADWIVLAPLLPFALALVVAPNRSRALAFTGVALVLVAALRIVLLEVVVEKLITDAAVLDPEAERAAFGVYDVLSASYERYDVYLILLGLIFVAFALLLGRLRRAGRRAPPLQGAPPAEAAAPGPPPEGSALRRGGKPKASTQQAQGTPDRLSS